MAFTFKNGEKIEDVSRGRQFALDLWNYNDNSDDEETAEPGDEATDVFGGDTEDPLGTNSEIEDIPDNTPKTVEDEKEETYQPGKTKCKR